MQKRKKKRKKKKKSEKKNSDERKNDENRSSNEKENGIRKNNIDVMNMDCIDIGINLLTKGYNRLILNMADANDPGGAQEENLFRGTSFAHSLVNNACLHNGGKHSKIANKDNNNNKNDKNSKNSEKTRKYFGEHPRYGYPIEEYGCIYCPKLFVFRGNESKGYPLLDNIYQI